MLNRGQQLSILSFIVLFLLLYFGCDTKSNTQKGLEKSRSFEVEAINIKKHVEKAYKSLLPDQKNRIDFLNNELRTAPDSLKINTLELLSSEWFKLDQALIAGHYAEQLAEAKNTEDAWAITGTTFGIALRSSKDAKNSEYCLDHSIQAFENAISLNPDNPDNKINLALNYVERPPEDNPMKGVLMMVDLNKKYPDNINVLMQLGFMSVRTNQTEKALNRFNRVLELEPNNNKAHCMLANIYSEAGDKVLAQKHSSNCK